MILELIAILIILIVLVCQFPEGLLGSFINFINILLAAFLAFNFWEPLASVIGEQSAAADRYIDAIALVSIFCIVLLLLRSVTARLVPTKLELPPSTQYIGSTLFGLLAGYCLAGFLLCVIQTLPLPQNFLGYDQETGIRIGKPDRVMLALMHRASGVVFDYYESTHFDADGSFTLRYLRYRRLPPDGQPLQNREDFPEILDTRLPGED